MRAATPSMTAAAARGRRCDTARTIPDRVDRIGGNGDRSRGGGHGYGRRAIGLVALLVRAESF